MTLLARIKKLEARLLRPTQETYWIMWRTCEWTECEGVMRNEEESIDAFKERVLKATNKKFLWVR